MQDLLYLMNNYVNGAVGRRSGRRYRRSIRKRRKRKKGDTYSSCFALVFQSFLRVLRCRLDVVDSVLDIVFDSVDHLTLFIINNRLLLIDHRPASIVPLHTSTQVFSFASPRNLIRVVIDYKLSVVNATSSTLHF